MSFYRYKYVLLAVVLVFGIPGSAPAPHYTTYGGSRITARSEVPASLLGVFQNALKAQKVQLEAELNAAKSVQVLLRKVKVHMRENPTLTSAKEGDNSMISRALMILFANTHPGGYGLREKSSESRVSYDAALKTPRPDLGIVCASFAGLAELVKISEANQAKLVKEINMQIKNLASGSFVGRATAQ